jgi:putative two-component system response regulator
MTVNNTKILIVDDEANIRRMLGQRLSREGYVCSEAGSTVEARRAIGANAVALVILDVRMPGQTGLELLTDLVIGYPDLPVIMATAVDDAATAVSCLKKGACDYLIKPFNLEEVSLSVGRALENTRLKTENRDYRLNLEKKVREQTARIRELFLNSIKAMALALEAKDEYTSDHSRRVAELAAGICKRLGMKEEDTEKVRVAGLVHDIGKIGIKEAILNKPGNLTEDESRQVQSHPRVAASMLVPIVDDSQIIESIVHHHERFDGTGYPDRLAGDGIPRGARILAVADAYEAMTSGRPYRKMISQEKACQEIIRNKGTQFDPVIADALLGSLNEVTKRL